MRRAGRITGEALLVARDAIKPGVSTKDIDVKIRAYIEKCGATPSFLGYNGFPASACISVNDEVIHGIPSYKTILKETPADKRRPLGILVMDFAGTDKVKGGICHWSNFEVYGKTLVEAIIEYNFH